VAFAARQADPKQDAAALGGMRPSEEAFPMNQKFTLNVNGQDHAVDADPDMPLLYALRDDIGLNNPHFGCGLAQCGACTVHLDGQPIRSCVTPVSSVGDGKVVTLAGLGTPEKPHPLQTAYVEEQVPQCG
jgi:nicotinate dehydrogenase subunit A